MANIKIQEVSSQIPLAERIQTKHARVAVLGLGYVGLPLAMEFARAGFSVVGIDISEKKVSQLSKGISYIDDVPTTEVAQSIALKKFHPSNHYEDLRSADAVVICVPTPLRKTQDPDVSFIVQAVEQIAKYMGKETLVVLESTTYPGTCEEVILPVLSERGRQLGKDFYLAFSPERIDPGNKIFNTRNIPKVIGGMTERCTEIAAMLYSQTVDHVVPVSSTRVAEMIKLLENTFRSVNIGLVNEIALMCDKMGIDVWEVIEGASTKPFGFTPFYPGPGLGGHCLPIDPLYLSWKARIFGFEARFIELASRVNASMPGHVVGKIVSALNINGKCAKGATVLLIGVAYKKDVSDTRESPAIDVSVRLRAMGATVCYNDPFVPTFSVEDKSLPAVAITEENLQKADCTVILTNHSQYDLPFIHRHATLLVDTRNALKGIRAGREKIHKL